MTEDQSTSNVPIDMDDDTKMNDNRDTNSDLKSSDTHNKMTLTLHTHLGRSRGEVYVEDLKEMEYFKNQLSGRWKTNKNMINISSDDLHFNITDFKMLLHFKRTSRINITYPFERLRYLMNACDYFTEHIKEEALIEYFGAYIPSIRPKDLISLNQILSHSSDCTVLQNAIKTYLVQLNDTANKINNKIVSNWRTVSSELLICNQYIAASIFMAHFKFIGRWMYQLNYFLEFAQHRDHKDLNLLWHYIAFNRLYVYYPQIIDNIFALEYQSDIKISKHTAKSLTRIVLDLIDATFRENDIAFIKHKSIRTLFKNYYKIIKDQEFEETIAECSYDFVMEILHKLLTLRTINEQIFASKFGDIDVLSLLINEFAHILTAISKRDLRNDIHSINTLLNEEEKCGLLKLLLENHQKMKMDIGALQNIIQPLIEVDYEQSFLLTILWFPLFMNTHVEWITKELPNKTSWNALQTLIFGITDYIASVQYQNNPCPKVYIDFINEFTNVDWNISSPN